GATPNRGPSRDVRGCVLRHRGRIAEIDASYRDASCASMNCDRKSGIRYRGPRKKGRRSSGAPFSGPADYLMKNVFRSASPCEFVKTYPPMRDAMNSRMFRFSYTASGACVFWTVKSSFWYAA